MDHLKKNPLFIKTIVAEVERKIKRIINSEEEVLIVNVIGRLPNSNLKKEHFGSIINTMSSLIADEIGINHCEINNVNIHEILKNIIKYESDCSEKKLQQTSNNTEFDNNITSIFGYHDISTLIKKVRTPINSINTVQLLFDTRYRSLSTDGTDSFTWDYMNQLVTSPGTVNSFGNIRDVISMTAMKFKIPNVLASSWDYELISITIEELISQSVIAHEKKRYHFLAGIDLLKSNDRWLYTCCDDYCDGVYNFNKPITTLNTLTFKFGSPLEPIKFDKDRLFGTIIYGAPTLIQFDEDHKLTTNDVIYIDNFTTSNAMNDYTVIKNMNNNKGNVITVVSPSSISILVDSSTIINNTIIKQYSVFFGSKRMFIPIEFKYLSR
jgi:hypothetical protein